MSVCCASTKSPVITITSGAVLNIVGRQPNSCISQRLEDGYWIDKIEIENPEYRVECKNRNDIYGIRDDILPNELEQQEYIEIDVYPGYYRGANTLPQLFLTKNGKIIMYAMGEYFLLERKSE